jgi:hypothetical protein
MDDVKVQASLRGEVLTVYVRLDENPPQVFLGGDYIEITEKLTMKETACLIGAAKRRIGKCLR